MALTASFRSRREEFHERCRPPHARSAPRPRHPAGHRLRSPLQAADDGRGPPKLDTGPALAVYLGQADASPTVCDPRAKGPHLGTFDDKARASLMSAYADGKIEPGLWRRCADALLKGSSE